MCTPFFVTGPKEIVRFFSAALFGDRNHGSHFVPVSHIQDFNMMGPTKLEIYLHLGLQLEKHSAKNHTCPNRLFFGGGGLQPRGFLVAATGLLLKRV